MLLNDVPRPAFRAPLHSPSRPFMACVPAPVVQADSIAAGRRQGPALLSWRPRSGREMWLTGINYCALRAPNTAEGPRLFLGVVGMLPQPWSAVGSGLRVLLREAVT